MSTSSPTSTLLRTTVLPQPSASHATCAWCRLDFATISDLLEHVDGGHLAVSA